MFPMWALESIAWLVIITGGLLLINFLLFLIIRLCISFFSQGEMIVEFWNFITWRKEKIIEGSKSKKDMKAKESDEKTER